MAGIAKCVVIGVNGQFGSILSRKLRRLDIEVCGIDIQDSCAQAGNCNAYTRDVLPDLTNPHSQQVLAAADCILCCTPESAIIDALPRLCTLARQDALLVDIASVKGRIACKIRELGDTPGYLSIHPMFGPLEDFSGRPMCLVRIRDNARTHAFIDLVRGWGPELVELSAEQHDSATACIQALPHALLIAFGATLASSGTRLEDLWKLGTPIQKTMLALLERVERGGSATYWSIQSSNPYAHQIRSLASQNLTQLSDAIDRGDQNMFESTLATIGNYFDGMKDELFVLSEKTVLLTKKPN